MKKFTEKQTRSYYNNDDIIYRSFWDKGGNCHWGYFPTDDISFGRAMVELNNKMLALSGINEKSTVLDLGCGNGNNSFFIHHKTGAKVFGIDLSDARIQNAQAELVQFDSATKKKISFTQSSATKLSFGKESFSHVWSQATLYHVHDKKKALGEVSRVLKKGGIFVFDDLIKPNKKVGKDAEKLVYERLLFDTHYTIVSYQEELEKLGFRILYAEDISRHYALSYWKLADILEQKIKKGEYKEFHDKYRKLIAAYRKTWGIMERGDVGWALFLTQKVK